MIDFNNLPKFQLISRLTNSPNLVVCDVDDNLLPDINFNYYLTSEFQNACNIGQVKSESSFSLLHCNIRSLSANHGSFIVLYFEFDVIGISETKIMLHKDPIINISMHNYSFISQPTWSNAGGVAFYIKKNISLHTRNDFTITTNDFELLSVEIHNNHERNTVCLVIYRHPHSNLQNFSDYLINVINKISAEQKYCVIMGDFNINLLNCESHDGTDDFLNTMSFYFFQPYILQPTRITDHSATLIDNIYFNSIEHVTMSGNLIYDISDHLPNFLIIRKLNYKTYDKEIFIRDYSHYNEQDFNEEISVVDWNTVTNTDDVDTAFNTFYDKLATIIDKHVPLKKSLNI